MKKASAGYGFGVVSAIILLQSTYFKFTSQPISKELFNALGTEPWGRYLTALAELITGALLLMPKTSLYGAICALIISVGAILAHVFVIGIAFGGDVSLFVLALTVFLLSAIAIYLNLQKH